MKHFIPIIKQLFSGQKQLSLNLKFSMLMVCVSAIHLCYSGFFFYQGLTSLAYYNLFVLFLYIGNCFFTYYRHYRLATFLTLGEIWLCGILFSLMLGWDTGYALFLLALVPILYYVSFSTTIFRHNILAPTILSLFCLIVYLTCWLITRLCYPYYTALASPFVIFMYLFNSITAFILVIVFSLFFLNEIYHIQTALREQNKRLDKIASIDSLTMLWNRRSMKNFLEKAIASYQTDQKEFSLILCDIDDFKCINDTYGHSCGDEVLMHIAELIRSGVRSDDFVCRWGGEEILILIQGPVEVAATLAERIRARIEQSPTLYDGQEIAHTMTFGVTAYLNNHPIEHSIRAADIKLYEGKKHGKNQVIA